MSRSAEMKTEYGTYKPWHKARIRSFVCTSGWTETGHPAQPIAKQNVPDARRVLPKDFPACIITHQAGRLHRKTLSFTKKLKSRKERGKTYEFLYNGSNGIKDSRDSNRCRDWRMGRHQPA